MSQRVKVLLPLVAMATLLVVHTDASAQVSRRTAGITLRGATWGWPDGRQRLVWASGEEYTYYDGEGVGGWISFISRASDQVLVELSLGGLVRTVEEVERPGGRDTYVNALIPLLLGARFLPFEPSHGSSLRPYVSFGAGPYWMADILSVETPSRDDVTVDTRHEFGGYVGLGADFMFTDWFGLNFDFKRHYVDFDADNDYSGSEWALGMQFMWGDRRPPSRGRRR